MLTSKHLVVTTIVFIFLIGTAFAWGTAVLPQQQLSYELWKCTFGTEGAIIPSSIPGHSCIKDIAIKRNDVRICDKIILTKNGRGSIPIDQGKCYFHFAMQENNAALCNGVPQCYWYWAHEYNDVSFCALVQPDRQKACVRNIEGR